MRGRFVLICLCLGLLIAPNVMAECSDPECTPLQVPPEGEELPPGRYIIHEEEGETEYSEFPYAEYFDIEDEIELESGWPIKLYSPHPPGSSILHYKEIK